MCFGGGDAPEAEVSQSEITAAKEAVAKHNERIDDGYLGLEQDAITQAKSADHSGYLRGVGAADLAQGEAQLYAGASGGRRALDFSSIGTATAASTANMTVDANKQGQQLKDSQMMGAIHTGQNQANTAAGGLMKTAANGLSSSFADLNAEFIKQNARNQALGQVASTGMAAGAYKEAQNEQPITKGKGITYNTNPQELNKYRGYA